MHSPAHSPHQEPTRLLTAEEVSSVLRIDTHTVYAMARAGKIPARRFGRRVRFLPSEVSEFIERQR